ncbi:MAG: 30S ribosomal protein S8e [Candidatus Pacearchaeota archaeon]|nr:30S ribosomal protein S8e [Candidatus Pacearchaeota archaeon]
MALGRKITGGKYHARRKKRLHERLRQERIVTLGETKTKKIRTRGGHIKTVLLKTNIANVAIGKKVQKAQITNVLETPANKFFARQNRLIKGAIIDTSLGKAKITNRPSQEAQVNAILIEEKKKT